MARTLSAPKLASEICPEFNILEYFNEKSGLTFAVTVGYLWFDRDGIGMPTTKEDIIAAAKHFKLTADDLL